MKITATFLCKTRYNYEEEVIIEFLKEIICFLIFSKPACPTN